MVKTNEAITITHRTVITAHLSARTTHLFTDDAHQLVKSLHPHGLAISLKQPLRKGLE